MQGQHYYFSILEDFFFSFLFFRLEIEFEKTLVRKNMKYETLSHGHMIMTSPCFKDVETPITRIP